MTRRVLFLLVLLSVTAASGWCAELQVRVLDVGEGQAVLLHQGEHGVLVDTGHLGVARQVLDRLQALQVETLDFLILTHPHPDHASGLFRIHEAFPEAVLADNCQPVGLSVPDVSRWIAEALERSPGRRCLTAGERIAWRGAIIEVLWPPRRPTLDDDLNGFSLVVRIGYGEQSLLIMGDAGQAAETALLQAGRVEPVDLLVVGHHGADDASSPAFLDALRPRVAVISTNRGNLRGYPAARVLKRLAERGIAVYKTYEDGEYVFTFHAQRPAAEQP